MLFGDVVFGPVQSRRLGVSLGINLLPVKGKICSFDCIYCECGYNEDHRASTKLPTRDEVKSALELKLKEMSGNGVNPDVLTFAGNGEPTMHPEFEQIIDDTIGLRNIYFPSTKISVLSNAAMIHKESVFRALNKVDNNILKLDSALDDKIRLINQPNQPSFSAKELIDNLKRFQGNLIIQTMFLSGSHNGISVDNTGDEEIALWMEAIEKINPKQVMIYTIDRLTPSEKLEKVSKEKLNEIAEKLIKKGFFVMIST